MICTHVCSYALGMVKQPMPARQVRVSDKTWEAARAVAAQNDETISDVIRRALVDYVEKNR